jgi:hypothetical protein
MLRLGVLGPLGFYTRTIMYIDIVVFSVYDYLVVLEYQYDHIPSSDLISPYRAILKRRCPDGLWLKDEVLLRPALIAWTRHFNDAALWL